MAPGAFGVVSPHPPIFIPAVGGAARHFADASLDALAVAGRAIGAYSPDTVILISPHAPLSPDTFVVDTSDQLVGTLAQFGDQGRYSWAGDPELAAAIVDRLDAEDIPSAPRDADPLLRPGWADHATIVPLCCMAVTAEMPLVIVSLSFLSFAHHRMLGEVIAACAEDLGRRVVLVASGDLSHRLTRDAPAGFSAQGAVLDAEIVELVRRGAFAQLMQMDPEVVEAGGECGLRSIIALGGFLGDDPLPARVLAYEGPWGVGYLTAVAGDEGLAALASVTSTRSESGSKGGMPGTQESDIVALARRSIEGYLGIEGRESPALSGAEYPPRAGTFVSLHRGGDLRGCIGTIGPTCPTLAEEVAYNAIQAAARDPRFPALRAEELGDLDIKVDVLHPPEGCELTDLDPSRYGVIVSSGGRRGLLLPDLEGVDDVETQVSIALQKAGIPAGTPCAIQRFRVDRYV